MSKLTPAGVENPWLDTMERLLANAERERLPMIVVYAQGTDGDHARYTARLWNSLPTPAPTETALRDPQIDTLREAFDLFGLTCLTRSEGDAPNILETWIL